MLTPYVIIKSLVERAILAHSARFKVAAHGAVDWSFLRSWMRIGIVEPLAGREGGVACPRCHATCDSVAKELTPGRIDEHRFVYQHDEHAGYQSACLRCCPSFETRTAYSWRYTMRFWPLLPRSEHLPTLSSVNTTC
jgi:hypothetical protein